MRYFIIPAIVLAQSLIWTSSATAQKFIFGFECPTEEIIGYPGDTVTIDVMVTLTYIVDSDEGAAGWNLSFTVDGGFIRYRDENGILSPTPGDDNPRDAKYMTRSLPGMPLEINTMFVDYSVPDPHPIEERIELADAQFKKTDDAYLPESDPIQKGVVSIIILGDSGAIYRYLPPKSKEPILRVTVSVMVRGDPDQKLVLKFMDGLRGQGFPVKNFIQYQGSSVPAFFYEGEVATPNPEMVLQECVIPVVQILSDNFRRGDVDGSGDLDITDVITYLNFQFVDSVKAIACLDSADIDDNGALDIADAIRSLNYQFTGSAPAPEPPGPYTCGPDIEEDDFAPCEYPEDEC